MSEFITRMFTPSDSDRSGMVGTTPPPPEKPVETNEKKRRMTKTILTSPKGLSDDTLTTLKAILGSQ